MKKIFQFILVFLTVGFSLISCSDYEDAPNTVHTIQMSAPIVSSITPTSANVHIENTSYPVLRLSIKQDMSDAVDLQFIYNPYYVSGKERKRYTANMTGLTPNTSYYIQYFSLQHCDNYPDGKYYAAVSPVTEFKTTAYEPTSYTINMTNVPMSGYYSLFMTDAKGGNSFENVEGGNTLHPTTKITDNSTVYVAIPYRTDTTDPKSVPVYGGTDFYYASGTVNPEKPVLSLTPRRFTAHVNVNITFKATNEEVSDLSLQRVTIANVNGNTPLCYNGILDLTTGQFTASQTTGREYVSTMVSSISSGKTVSRTFAGVLPVTFGNNTVKVVVTLAGDITNKETAIPVPAATWAAGSDVTLNLSAEYTAAGVEITLSGVEVKPWTEGSTGNIDIKK